MKVLIYRTIENHPQRQCSCACKRLRSGPPTNFPRGRRAFPGQWRRRWRPWLTLSDRPRAGGRANGRTAQGVLHDECGSRLRYVVPRSLADVRRGHLLRGARKHACLNASSVGVSVVLMASSRKFAPLLEELTWRHPVDRAGAARYISARVRRESAATVADLDAVNRVAHERFNRVLNCLRSGTLAH